MQTSLRLSDELAAQLEARAKQNHRSRNAEIVSLIEQAIWAEPIWAEQNRKLDGISLLPETIKLLKAGEVEEGTGPGTPFARAGVVPVPSSTSSHKQRKTKCEHRVPPGSWCKRCDQ